MHRDYPPTNVARARMTGPLRQHLSGPIPTDQPGDLLRRQMSGPRLVQPAHLLQRVCRGFSFRPLLPFFHEPAPYLVGQAQDRALDAFLRQLQCLVQLGE